LLRCPFADGFEDPVEVIELGDITLHRGGFGPISSTASSNAARRPVITASAPSFSKAARWQGRCRCIRQ